MPNKNTLNWRVVQLEKNYSLLDKKIDSILQNHLPGMRIDIQSLETEIQSLKSYIVGATIFNIAAIIIGITISKFLL